MLTKNFTKPRTWKDLFLKWLFMEVDWEDMDWIYLAQDREKWQAVVNEVINLRVSSNSVNFLSN